MDDLIERVARVLCSIAGHNPDALAPGNCPESQDDDKAMVVADGYNAKGEFCHFYWRAFATEARAAIAECEKEHRENIERLERELMEAKERIDCQTSALEESSEIMGELTEGSATAEAQTAAMRAALEWGRDVLMKTAKAMRAHNLPDPASLLEIEAVNIDAALSTDAGKKMLAVVEAAKVLIDNSRDHGLRDIYKLAQALAALK